MIIERNLMTFGQSIYSVQMSKLYSAQRL